MAASADDVEDNILYDLTIHAEWPQEPETFTRSQKERTQASVIGKLTSATQRSVWTSLRTLGLGVKNASPCNLPVGLVRLVNCQLNWHIAISSDGSFVSVLQDQHVEIRSARDDFGSVVGRGGLPRDVCPQWRRTAWSPDCTMVACSSSSGQVDVFDVVGAQLMTIPGDTPSKQVTSLDLSRAVTALIFIDVQPLTEWTAQLLVINYHGTLKRYLLDREKGYKLQHSFQFSVQYPLGVSAVVYQPAHKLLLLGGSGECGTGEQSPNLAVQEGITAWRMLSDYPHYKLVTDYAEDLYRAKQKNGVLKRIRNMTYYSWHDYNPDGVYKMCLSPDGQILVSIHHTGKLCLWDVPSLRKRNCWPHEDQPGHDEISPDFAESPVKRKLLKDLVQSRNLLDVNWWSEKEVILARCSGAVTVSSTQTLKNLLGTSPEWFEPSPRVTETHDGGFLGLECECQFPSLKRRLVASEDDDYDDSDDEEISMVTRTTRLAKHALYYMTDSERFQPPRKRPRLVTRTYRLVRLKSTTPEELYEKKINSEEYGEALALARAYGLDCDKVYQRQWWKSPVSVASIQDYLSKISKRSWVLHECLERVPENIDAMKELLEYGLRGTDLQALIAIGKGEDGGRFILCDPDDEEYEDIYNDFDQDANQEREERKKKKRQELAKQVDFKNLNLEQRQLCKDRMKLLQYLDRLNTYELMLGGKQAAEMRFDHKFFEKFRAQNIVEGAVEHARVSDDKAVDILLTFHGGDLRTHRLAILSNFPETTSPFEFRNLLPEISHGSAEASAWEEDKWREEDWCEEYTCRHIVDPLPVDLGAFLYEENPDYLKFRSDWISSSLLSDWYEFRACEIERLANQVDNALELVKLAIERGVEDLGDLHDDLVTMEMMVYECGLDESLVFEEVRTLTDLEKIQLFMSKTSLEMYNKNVRRWLIPYLQRCEKKSPGAYNILLRKYIILNAKEDLIFCSKLFETSTPGVSCPVIVGAGEMMSMALDAIYTSERDDQLTLACSIFECLPHIPPGKKNDQEYSRLHKLVDELERHLRAAKILEKQDLKQSIKTIKKTQNDPEETKQLMIKLTRKAGHRSPALTDNDWWDLFEDVQILQSQVYRSITQDLCLQIFAESLLCSGKLANIKLVGELVERSAKEKWENKPFHGKLTHDTAIELVVGAAREYFDSSANLTDPCMDLARACLHLIRDSPAIVQQELDLISSLALLDDFGVDILPLQVRLCKDRLSLVAKAVDNRPNAYKQSQKLLRLGHLLRVPGDSQVDKDGQVLHLVTDAAIKSEDFGFAYEICSQLMSDSYDPIWTACRDLAEQVHFQNIRAKAELLSFSVTYCDSDMIEPILKAKCLLETQILFDTVTSHMESEGEGGFVTPRSSPFSPTAALKQTQELLASTTRTTKNILSSTTQTTRAVLSTVTDAKWWQKTIMSLKQPSKLSSQASQEMWDDGNVHFEKQGCPLFYSSLNENCYSTRFGCEGTSTAETSLPENLLRTAKLEELLTEGTHIKSSSEVLLQLAGQILNHDSMLGLAYLLSLHKGEEAETVFDNFPSTGISLQLAAYYYALQIYHRSKPSTEAHRLELYNHSPSEVIHKVMGHVMDKPEEDWVPEVRALVTKVQYYYDLLEDYKQAKLLQGLGRGVDVSRFTEDTEYKHETILGLAMSLEEEVYTIAVSLAVRYELSLWEVYMTHLEFLFSDSGLSTPEVVSRLTKLNIVDKLTADAPQFISRMQNFVLPTIEGTDHIRLMYYYSMFSGCNTDSQDVMSPDTHVKLLKKLKPATPGLDYKKLVGAGSSPVDVIRPILNSGNVHVIAKLANKIPNQKGGFLHASLVYSAWASKLFWEGDQSNKCTPETMADWVHRYEVCGDFIQRLLPADMVSCIDNMLFTKASREQLTLEGRTGILRRALKFSRQQGGKKKKQDTSGSSMSWEEAVSHFQQCIRHIDLLSHETLLSMSMSEDGQLVEYAEMYDLSRGDIDKLKQLLVQMVLDGRGADLVNDLLTVCAVEKWTPRTAVQEAVNVLIQAFRDGEAGQYRLQGRETLDVLKEVVDSVKEHQDAGGDLVCSEDVVSLLRPFCADSSVPAQPRLDTLEILEQAFPVTDEDMVLLTLYRTNAIVSSCWPHTKVLEENVHSDESRLCLFEGLLADSDSVDQFLSLSKLLTLWPPLSTVQISCPGDAEGSPWVRLFTGLINTGQPEAIDAVIKVVRELEDSSPLHEQCVQHMCEQLLRNGQQVVAVKLVLTSSHSQLYDEAITHISACSQEAVDVDLVELILQRSLLSGVVEMPCYSTLFDYIVSNQTQEFTTESYLSPHKLASELREAGYLTEAGTLLMQCRSTHPILRTFNAARSVLGRWLKN